MDAQTGTPEKRKPARWEKAFLTAFRETGIVTRACISAKVGRRTVYHHKERCGEFAELWEEAYQDAMDRLEDEARRRAVDGLVRMKFKRNGDPIRHPFLCECGHRKGEHFLEGSRCRGADCGCDSFLGAPYFEHEYSDTLLIFLLKGGRPEKFRDRFDIGMTNDDIDKEIKQELGKLAHAGEEKDAGEAAQTPPSGAAGE